MPLIMRQIQRRDEREIAPQRVHSAALDEIAADRLIPALSGVVQHVAAARVDAVQIHTQAVLDQIAHHLDPRMLCRKHIQRRAVLVRLANQRRIQRQVLAHIVKITRKDCVTQLTHPYPPAGSP